MLKTVLIASLLSGALASPSFAEGPHHHGGAPYRPDSSRYDNRNLVALGQRLFFDPVLSGSGETACASCHDPRYGYAEPRRVSIFDSGKHGPRNAPGLINARYTPRLMLDGRFPSLEKQVSGPMQPNGEMGSSLAAAARRLDGDASYREHFFDVFHEPPAPGGIAAALAAFQRTLLSRTSRFDRFLCGKDEQALTRMERWGWEIFTTKGRCAGCHAVNARRSGFPLLTDFRFHNTGAAFDGSDFRDPGRYRVTLAERHLGSFRTPSLRNVAVTAPYMHNGSLRTLEDVVEFYDAGGRANPNLSPRMQPLDLSDEEKQALVAFLYSLTDEDYEAAHARLGPDGRR